MNVLRLRAERVKRDIKSKTTRDGWINEKQPMTFADEYSWSNRDQDVTPLERRTWTSWVSSVVKFCYAIYEVLTKRY